MSTIYLAIAAVVVILYSICVVAVLSETQQGEEQRGIEYLMIALVLPLVILAQSVYRGIRWALLRKQTQ